MDDLWQEMTQVFAPSLSDSEIITMEIVGEFKEIDTDKNCTGCSYLLDRILTTDNIFGYFCKLTQLYF